jgi:hypothetical protein
MKKLLVTIIACCSLIAKGSEQRSECIWVPSTNTYSWNGIHFPGVFDVIGELKSSGYHIDVSGLGLSNYYKNVSLPMSFRAEKMPQDVLMSWCAYYMKCSVYAKNNTYYFATNKIDN